MVKLEKSWLAVHYVWEFFIVDPDEEQKKDIFREIKQRI